MDRSRREFLKKAFWLAGGGAAGFAYLNSIGIGPKEAKAIGVESHATTSPVGAGPNTSWATWDETTEAGYSGHVYTALAEGGASANEIGQGVGLSEADRTLTQTGNIAAATGSGTDKYRQMDGVNDMFTMTENFASKLEVQTKWQLLLKVREITDVDYDMFLYFVGATSQILLRIVSNKLELHYNENGIPAETLPTVNSMAFGSSTPTYISAFADGTNNVRFFHYNSASKPTSWDDIAAGDKAILVTGGFNGTFAADTWSHRFLFDNGAGARTPTLKWHYFVMSIGKTLFE